MSVDLPVTRDDKSGPFFDAAAESRLAVRRCSDCGRILAPEAQVCTQCAGITLEWATSAGTGHLVTWAVVHRAPNPVYVDLVPYVVGVIELDEGPWIYGLADVVEPRAGLRVQAAFPDVAHGERYPIFVKE